MIKKLGSGKPERVRNIKNSAFFFIKSIVYLKSYINFEEIIN